MHFCTHFIKSITSQNSRVLCAAHKFAENKRLVRKLVVLFAWWLSYACEFPVDCLRSDGHTKSFPPYLHFMYSDITAAECVNFVFVFLGSTQARWNNAVIHL